jgi:hypothetical protein
MKTSRLVLFLFTATVSRLRVSSEAALIRLRSDPPKPVASPLANTKREAHDRRKEFWWRKAGEAQWPRAHRQTLQERLDA